MLGSDKSETGGEDVMDDENDKVSRDVVGVPSSHEFLGPHPATLLTWPGHDMVTSDNIDKEDDDKYFEKVPNPHSNLQVDLIHTIVSFCQTSTCLSLKIYEKDVLPKPEYIELYCMEKPYYGKA